jgi:hypothetical protein
LTCAFAFIPPSFKTRRQSFGRLFSANMYMTQYTRHPACPSPTLQTTFKSLVHESTTHTHQCQRYPDFATMACTSMCVFATHPQASIVYYTCSYQRTMRKCGASCETTKSHYPTTYPYPYHPCLSYSIAPLLASSRFAGGESKFSAADVWTHSSGAIYGSKVGETGPG